MPNYLAIQNTYHDVQLGIYTDERLLGFTAIHKFQASKELIIKIDSLLQHAHLQLDDIDFIVANEGPGPFTTLRVVITTINGLSFAKRIPLIGVNALWAAAHEWKRPGELCAILFNAFGNDLYALLIKNDTELLYGVYRVEDLLTALAPFEEKIRFLGNGSDLHRESISVALGERAILSPTIPSYSSLKQIASMGYSSWSNGCKTSYQLEPLYLKQHPIQQ